MIFGNDPDGWSEQLEDYINGKIRRGQDVQLVAEDGDILTLAATSTGKLSDNHTSDGRTMSDEAYVRKVNAAAHIDELAQVSRQKGHVKADREGRHGDMAIGGWAYRTAYFEDFDGRYYALTISTALGPDGKMVYNIGQMKEEASPKVKGSRAENGNGPRGFASSGNSISKENGDVKTKFSASAEQAQTGQQAQQEDEKKKGRYRDLMGEKPAKYVAHQQLRETAPERFLAEITALQNKTVPQRSDHGFERRKTFAVEMAAL